MVRQPKNIRQAIEAILFLFHDFDLVDFLLCIARGIKADELTEERLAGAAPRSRLAVLANSSDRRARSFANRGNDLAFGDRVAVANLGFVGEARQVGAGPLFQEPVTMLD